MPWVRIDENAMDHPKFLALSDGAWRLWCEGLSYCQKHLTDGVIQPTALKGFRYFSQSRLKNLTTEFIDGKGPCWDLVEGHIHVHDYLDWNDSRDEVMEAREGARDRRRRYNRRNASGNASLDGDETPNVPSGVSVFADEYPKAEKERTPKPAEVQRERFERFWHAYPRKVGKDAAWREWKKRAPAEALTAEILTALAAQSVTPQWLRDGGQFVPHPRTWLHQGRWQDEPERRNGVSARKPGLTGAIPADKQALYDAGVIR